jgi:hypothetical protein
VKTGLNTLRSTKGPTIFDLTKDDEKYGFRPTTAVLAQQLNAIQEHNINLPPRKKAKETVEEF